ncbi:pentapeptide repeat-containing protein [Luedemannella flava]
MRWSGDQRVTDTFSTAVAQLADPRPPVRLGGLYTLEFIGQDNPAQRPAVADVICAYLRMPWAATNDDVPVRRAAQQILARHLRPVHRLAFWPGIGLDLTGAHLIGLDLTGCRVDGVASFDRAVLHESTMARGTVFCSDARFRGAVFTSDAWFDTAVFHAAAHFETATFHGDAWFGGVDIASSAGFSGVVFNGHAWFAAAVLRGRATFNDAIFQRSAGFRGARCDDGVVLAGATFRGPARVSRRGDGWNICPPGWRVATDPDNEAVGHLHWAGALDSPDTRSTVAPA